MLFKRRDRLKLRHRLREHTVPRKGWDRGIRYIAHRVKRLPDSPHKIALGAALGIFVSFSPIFGIHMLMAVIAAYIVRANVLAAFILTFFGGPLTYPFIAAGSLVLGRWILGQDRDNAEFEAVHTAFYDAAKGLWHMIKGWFGYGDGTPASLYVFFTDIFWPYLIGGTILGLIAALILYFVLKPLIATYQSFRRERAEK